MLVKFGLPNGAGGMAAAHGAAQLRKHIAQFESQTNCTVRVWSFHKEFRNWLCMDVPDSHKSLFSLYWSKDMSFMGWEPLAANDPTTYRNGSRD